MFTCWLTSAPSSTPGDSNPQIRESMIKKQRDDYRAVKDRDGHALAVLHLSLSLPTAAYPAKAPMSWVTRFSPLAL